MTHTPPCLPPRGGGRISARGAKLLNVITQQEFEAILADETKRIEGDIFWRPDPGHTPAVRFRAPVHSEPGWPLSVFASWNPGAGKLGYTLLLQGEGRIYALNMGIAHTNPGGETVGDVHKHRWTEEFRDKWAYVPEDITATWDRPVEVWREFCAEAGIKHSGTLAAPEWQEGLAV